MAENQMNELEQKEMTDDQLMAAISSMGYSEYSRLQDFVTLTQNLKQKQDALDIMAADTTPSAIGSSYVADTLEPNSQGDLITLVAKSSGEQVIIDDIYRRLNIPLDKVVYSLFKNAIAIAEFAHEGDLVEEVKQMKPRKSALEEDSSTSKESKATMSLSATEDIMVKIHNSKLAPKIRLLSDTTRVFPILQYESIVGYIEVTTDELKDFDFGSDYLTYKDVVIHSAEDYSYVKFGFRTESKPLQLRVRMENGSVMEYDIDQGRSLLEASYPAWQTLSIMKDAVNLARLAYSATSVVVQTEVGNMSEPQIELARNKLKDLFENRLTFGRNGAKSYLQPQVRPNYIYAFTNNGVGSLSTTTIGGDYNPGVLTDLRYFEDEFFGGMGAVKQHYARTEDAGGLDGGGAVEQYEKRYRSYVSQFKRLVAQFIKECINRVLLSRDLMGVYNNFEVIVNKAYEEEDMQVVNHQQTKLSFLQSAIEFMEIDDPKKLKELKLQVLKTVITDKSLLEAFSTAVLEEPSPQSDEEVDDSGSDEFDDFGDSSGDLGGGGGDLMDQINNLNTPGGDSLEDLPDDGETGTTGEDDSISDELPPVSEVVPEDQIEE